MEDDGFSQITRIRHYPALNFSTVVGGAMALEHLEFRSVEYISLTFTPF